MADITVTAAKVAGNLDTLTRSYKAAETITAGQAVYKLADGTVGIADANGSGKQQYRGIALNGGGTGEAIQVAYFGAVEGFTLAGNVDTFLYLSDTAGSLADSNGTMNVKAGRVDMRDDGTKFLFTDVSWLVAWA